ncbi:MAG: TIGR04255 family protein [Candidatus Tectomicrobia bacterium]|nr:TIGR04255 family protein [Candidatus Tectomicrobia bacterium]
MSTEKRYKNPPIAEALCEIHFEEGLKWNATFFGLFHERIKDEFPEAKELHGMAMGIRVKPGGIDQRLREAGIRMRFHHKDKTSLVQVSKNLLAVNLLPKYPGWEMFKPLILERLKDYISVIQPKAIVRIGLRYINRIALPEAEFKFDQFFAKSSYLPSGVFQESGPFLVRVEPHPYEEAQLNVTVAAPAEPMEKGKVSNAVDLDHVAFNRIEPPSEEKVGMILEEAHSKIVGAFESIIGDKLRERFAVEA